ncbi:MAG: hypothetical protein L6R41_003556 [Letrouitia leprolyta]|nr:MAG: hypothetical protein L6R41_003556 [Letrouitia leprolyta]
MPGERQSDRQRTQQDPGVGPSSQAMDTSLDESSEVFDGFNADQLSEEEELDESQVSSLQYRERSMIPNFGDSYWRFLFIVKACNAYGDKDMVQKLGNQMFRPDALTAENIAWAAELGDQLNENVEQPDIVLQTPNQATADQYLRLQNLMDNEEYQREDYSDACRRIGITSGTNSRLPSMSRGVEVYMWQVIAMDQLT